MINRSLDSDFVHPRLPRLQPLIVGTLSILGITVGLLSAQVSHAQQSPADLEQYTSIAMQIERQRMQDYAEVKKLMGGSVPENVCQKGDIPQKVREVCDRFDKNSRDIIQANGMTVPKFNEITRYCQQTPKPKDCPR
jgi:hypothetical protein